VEDTFRGKMLSDAWTIIAEKPGCGIALRVSMGLGGNNLTPQILTAKAATVDAIPSLGNL
jgi:hypothetical protein